MTSPSLVDHLKDLRDEPRRFDNLPGSLTGTIRLDIQTDQGVDRWFLIIDKGQVSATKDWRRPDLVMQTSTQTFDDLTQGNTRVLAALFRNAMQVEGDLRLMTIFERVLPVKEMRTHGGGRVRESYGGR